MPARDEDEPLDDETPSAEPAAPTVPAAGFLNGIGTGTGDDIADLEKILRDEDVSTGVVKLYRRGPTATRFGFCQEIQAREFTVEWVKTVYGGGTYNAKLFGRQGNLYRQFSFEIDPRAKGAMDAPSIQPMQAMQPPRDNDGMLAMVMQSQQAGMQFMAQMMAESQKTMATIVAAALGGGNRGDREPVAQLLQAATGLIGNRRPEPSPAEQMGSMLVLMRELKALSAGDGGEKEESTGDKILGLLGTAVPGLVQAFASRGQPMPQAPQPRQVQPDPRAGITAPPVCVAAGGNPVPAGQPGAVLPAGTAEFLASLDPRSQALVMQLRQVWPLIRQGAALGTNTDSFLDILDAALDDESDRILKSILARPDWKAILFGEPDPQPAHWFDALRDGYLVQAADDGTAVATFATTPAILP